MLAGRNPNPRRRRLSRSPPGCAAGFGIVAPLTVAHLAMRMDDAVGLLGRQVLEAGALLGLRRWGHLGGSGTGTWRGGCDGCREETEEVRRRSRQWGTRRQAGPGVESRGGAGRRLGDWRLACKRWCWAFAVDKYSLRKHAGCRIPMQARSWFGDDEEADARQPRTVGKEARD
jgi:hypothetical protein